MSEKKTTEKKKERERERQSDEFVEEEETATEKGKEKKKRTLEKDQQVSFAFECENTSPYPRCAHVYNAQDCTKPCKSLKQVVKALHNIHIYSAHCST